MVDSHVDHIMNVNRPYIVLVVVFMATAVEAE